MPVHPVDTIQVTDSSFCSLGKQGGVTLRILENTVGVNRLGCVGRVHGSVDEPEQGDASPFGVDVWRG